MRALIAEVFWIFLFGAALAWLKAQSQPPQPSKVTGDTWQQWEQEIHDWSVD